MPVSGYALDYAWNLNPRDVHAGTSTKKEADYLAAVALKTATSRSGVAVSPYNRANLTGGQSFSANELNQGETGYRTYPDLASKGTPQRHRHRPQGLPWYTQNCKWASDWGRPELTPQSVAGASVFPIGSASNQALLGLNIGDTTPRRCPSFATCEPGQSCCIGKFSLGWAHSCATRTDSTVWCWGDNSNGQLGRGDVAPSAPVASPVLVGPGGASLTGAIDVALGHFHSCARRSDGSVWCWGAGANGELGDGSLSFRFSPVRVVGLDGSAVEELVVGSYHGCVRRTDGAVYCWGANSNGQLGDGSTSRSSVAKRVQALGTAAVELIAGSAGTCARLADGTLWCWGNNYYGRLGDGTTVRRLLPTQITAHGTTAAGMALGYFGTFVRRKDGTLWASGSHFMGALGIGSGSGGSNPVLVTALGTSVIDVVAGVNHACARKADGTVWCWGRNFGGALPVQVTDLETTTAALAAGAYATCARRTDGKLWCWGSNNAGQLGDGLYLGSSTPHAALGLQCECGDGVCSRSETRATCPVDCRQESCGDGKCTAAETPSTCSKDCAALPIHSGLSVGYMHACANRTDGSLWCWGTGYLGDDLVPPSRTSPVRVTAFGTGAVALVESATRGCARRANGTLWCWGRGVSSGGGVVQVGDGTSLTRATPVAITALGSTVADIAVEKDGYCARRTDGRLWCWGANASEEPGADPLSVRLVSALGTTVAQVAVGEGHTCARRTDGSLWCWGSNGNGALGDGTLITRYVPMAVTALGTSVAGVVAGFNFTCARRTDGTAWCWGSNESGRLGDGTTVQRLGPTKVTALGSSVAKLAAGYGPSACARRTDGSLWCWGRNSSGQLGDGSSGYSSTMAYSATPVPVVVLGTSVVEVGLGSLHSCARRVDGSVFCSGSNTGGQLGTDATIDATSSTPLPLAPCGDGICSLPERQSGGCAADCAATCGDCVCDGVIEDAASCPADCVAGNTCTPGTCGDGKCDATESCQLCASDCGSCYPF
ncbi:MAG: hypothetical protein IPL40_14445 [Proteobacteria bacterium]|nr:hypothetical protein [Pseudomonadota bacterium]